MRRYEVNVDTPIDEVIELSHQYVSVRRALIEALSSSSRLVREYSSQVLLDMEREDWRSAEGQGDVFIDALHRPEAPTRYNCLEVLGILASHDMRVIDAAWDEVEECLYDEESGAVRLAAFKVLTAYGASTTPRSRRAWLLISDALRCYHGDPEFMTMLNEFIEMLKGNVDVRVLNEARELFAFNAENATGLLRRKSQEIVSMEKLNAARKKKEAKAAAQKDRGKKTPTAGHHGKKAHHKKSADGKDAPKKAASKKGSPQKASNAKASTQKGSAGKAPAQKAAATKAPAPKSTAKKAPTPKSPAKKAPAQKPVAKRAPAQKAAAKKTPAKKTTSKTTSTKSTASAKRSAK